MSITLDLPADITEAEARLGLNVPSPLNEEKMIKDIENALRRS